MEKMEGTRMPPVKNGDRLLIEVIGKDEEKHPDDRIAKVDSYIVFIKDCNANIGEKVDVEITAALPKYAFAKEAEVIPEDVEDF